MVLTTAPTSTQGWSRPITITINRQFYKAHQHRDTTEWSSMNPVVTEAEEVGFEPTTPGIRHDRPTLR